ncbi:MAG: helix-turn-helix domain-containing protein [Actinomycetota bacterium]|nr:helix-turn-helix domain-containing protein [Actinomycetota bacterium]
MPEPAPIEVHKALADDTRHRLYRYLQLSGRPVSVRELSVRLSLHPNTLRPHLRRLQDAGLVATESRKGERAGRPQTLYVALAREEREGRDYRLLADILTGLLGGKRQQERARESAQEWGGYLVGKAAPKPGARRRSGPDLAVLQEALAEAGFDPRFRRRSAKTVDITLRDCPFRDLLEEHRDLVCGIHRGLLEGMLASSRPAMALTRFEPTAGHGKPCRLTARGA